MSAAELAFRTSILLGAAWLAASLTRAARGSAAVRHGVWMLGFASIASLPVLARLLPPLFLPVLPAQAAVVSAPIGAVSASPASATEVHFDWLSFAYFSVLLLLMARLVVGRIVLERLWQKAEPIDRWHVEIGNICRLLAISRRIEVRVTGEPLVPMTWGSMRPRILLPRTALAWSSGKLRNVLLHELGHVSRHDSLCAFIAQTICAFYWANPLVWLAVRQMQLAQEQACDDLVLANHAPATSYARDLLDSACALEPRFAETSLAMAARTDLEKRLRSILGEECRRPMSGWFLATAAVTAALSGALVATVVPVAAEAPAPLLQSATTIGHVQKASLVLANASKSRHEPDRRTAASSPMPSRSAELIPAAVYVAEPRPSADPVDHYRQQAAVYELAVDRYQDELRTYRRKCDEYRREVQEYRAKLASLRPGDVPPVQPVAPVQPVQPVAPVQPVIPPTPPTPPTPPST